MTSLHCLGCLHYRGKLQCSAYPDRIPSDILKGFDAHQSVRADQTGRDTYQMDPELARKLAEVASSDAQPA